MDRKPSNGEMANSNFSTTASQVSVLSGEIHLKREIQSAKWFFCELET
jgi:hypothetical protein